MTDLASYSRLRELLRLKSVVRTGWTRHPIPEACLESVADHSYGVLLLAWFLCPPDLSREHVMELALIHDLAEIEVGDLTPGDGVDRAEKEASEREALGKLTAHLQRGRRALELLIEYQEQKTPEARWVKALDKLEMSLQSLNYEGEFGVELSEFRESARPYLDRL